MTFPAANFRTGLLPPWLENPKLSAKWLPEFGVLCTTSQATNFNDFWELVDSWNSAGVIGDIGLSRVDVPGEEPGDPSKGVGAEQVLLSRC